MNLGAFSLVAIPLSSLDGHWVAVDNMSQLEPIDLEFTRATPTNPNPTDAAQFPGLLRLNLAEPRDASFGPWVLALHAFSPRWKGPEGEIPSEIYVVGYEKGPDGTTNHLLSYRLQLARVSKAEVSRASNVASVTNGLAQQVTAGNWQLRLVKQSCAHSETLPWNALSISNAGRMFSLHGTLNCYTLFSDEPQPTNRLPHEVFVGPRDGVDITEPDPVVITVEPNSGDVAVGMPGMFRILRFDAEER